jgi:hypothetical protein
MCSSLLEIEVAASCGCSKVRGLTFLRPAGLRFGFKILPSDDQKILRCVFAFVSGKTRPETQHGFLHRYCEPGG